MANYLTNDTDLEAVADAIRTKGGTSADLVFPQGFVDAIDAIETGGGEASSVVRFQDFVVTSTKWTLQNSVPNVLGDGGCIHYIFDEQENTSTTADCSVFCFGYGSLSAWNPGATNPSAYGVVYKASNSLVLQLRGVGNVSINLAEYKDTNGRVDIKFYLDHFLDVSTNTTHLYSELGTDIDRFFSVLSTKPYISIGVNQSTPLAGAVVALFALEES